VVAGKDDERLVSYSLDLAEMMFNIESIKEKIKLITWDKENQLDRLKKSTNKGHRQLGEAMGLYLEQDKESYNFDLLKRLYLIEYDHKIIGCTSPSTLFFATANDLDFAKINLTNNYVTFGAKYTPLYERDPEFQKYMHLLFKSKTMLSKRLGAINEYLEKNLKILDQVNNALYREINNLDPSTFESTYAELDTGATGDLIEVIGIPLRKRKKEDVLNAIQSSDFLIRSEKYKGEWRPLVLQNNLNKSFRYVNDSWDNSIKVPFVDRETALDKRRLPGMNIQYPYLTVSDFLEPYLIRLVYPINKEKYFDGNVTVEVGDESKGYLLPIKREFFDFFDSDDLLSPLAEKPRITMVQGTAGSVKVSLKIPVARQGEYITFERLYHQSPDNQIPKPEEEVNKGYIIEQQFGITLFPFIRTKDPDIQAYYRVQLVDRNITGVLKSTDYDLRFFANNVDNEINRKAKQKRSVKNPAQFGPGSQYYVLDKEFDFIQVNNTVTRGIVIPIWKTYQRGNETFSFAVDFGTTNTHVEYKVGQGNPKPFDITPADVQIATLFDPLKTTENFGGTGAIEIRELIYREFTPDQIGNRIDSKYRFPHRTVIAESYLLNVETETYTLADFNIPFTYERESEKDKIQTNLKWARKEFGNETRVRAFFENLMMLMRNKVLFNNGNLAHTKLVWFYPSSMKPARKSQLESAWNELFIKYFNPTQRAIGITESLAPFFYFKGTNKLQGGSYKPVVSIDIGGGTTDIVVFLSNKPLLMTSFKFAANAIFGDGFSEYGAANSNGLINKYYPHYLTLLEKNNMKGLLEVLTSIREKNRTEDLNAFFFSIENNPLISDKKLFSYNSSLANDEDIKILFLYFYCAIIYHIADLMRIREAGLPKNIVFSGTGSKILNVITPDFRILENLTKLVFEDVSGQSFDKDGLSIETEKQMPKEVTCKGGLMSNAEDLSIDLNKIKATNTCVEGVKSLKYEQLNNDILSSIEGYVEKFNAYFIDLNARFNYTDYFNVSPVSFDIFKNEINKHLRGYMEEGLEFNKKMDGISTDNTEIEETLFFYPLIGAISNLITPLSQLSPINK
jgi:hypothetical protein